MSFITLKIESIELPTSSDSFRVRLHFLVIPVLRNALRTSKQAFDGVNVAGALYITHKNIATNAQNIARAKRNPL